MKSLLGRRKTKNTSALESASQNVQSEATEKESLPISAFTSPDLEITDDGVLVKYCGSSATVRIPHGVVRIEEYAFRGNNTVREVYIPSGITEIGSYAFASCPSLRRVFTESGLKTIGRSAFLNCVMLESISLPDGLSEIGGGAFLGCTHLSRITIPSGVTHIRYDTFHGCIRLAAVCLPETLEIIGEGAFIHCIKLSEITLPSGLTVIGGNSFSYCTSLTTISLPEGLSEIGTRAFLGCSGLSHVVIPGSVGKVGDYAFSSCTGLRCVEICKGNLTDLVAEVFYKSDGLEVIYAPDTLRRMWGMIRMVGLRALVCPKRPHGASMQDSIATGYLITLSERRRVSPEHGIECIEYIVKNPKKQVSLEGVYHGTMADCFRDTVIARGGLDTAEEVEAALGAELFKNDTELRTVLMTSKARLIGNDDMIL